MTAKRKYEPKRRAESQAATRQRIVEAAVQLHATVGPAHTTVVDIAKSAGVERVVYHTFRTSLPIQRLLRALPSTKPIAGNICMAGNRRSGRASAVALSALYAYYHRTAPMLRTCSAMRRPCQSSGRPPSRAGAASPMSEISFPGAGRPAGASVSASWLARSDTGLPHMEATGPRRESRPDEAVQMMIGLVRHTVHPELDAVTG